MAVGGRHKLNVSIEKIVGVVTLFFIQGINQQPADLDIERVFPGIEKLVIVDSSFAPVASLFVKNFPLCILCRVTRTPQNTVRVGDEGIFTLWFVDKNNLLNDRVSILKDDHRNRLRVRTKPLRVPVRLRVCAHPIESVRLLWQCPLVNQHELALLTQVLR